VTARFPALIIACVAACLSACAGAERSANAPSDAPGESLVRLMEGLARDVESAGESCSDFAELVSDWVERERGTIEALVDDLDQRVGEMTEAEIEALDERLTTAFEVIVHRASECGEHPGAQRAFGEFDAVIEGS
jgi:hypothetical protein